ncbi:MAG TPA: hypothetical protein VJ865_16285, partial [Gemmatimonadaceae bacterium]|nr:hypothetical protein [Gemmatimonadaceae bacterium]
KATLRDLIGVRRVGLQLAYSKTSRVEGEQPWLYLTRELVADHPAVSPTMIVGRTAGRFRH